jgi:hypothetical protein
MQFSEYADATQLVIENRLNKIISAVKRRALLLEQLSELGSWWKPEEIQTSVISIREALVEVMASAKQLVAALDNQELMRLCSSLDKMAGLSVEENRVGTTDIRIHCFRPPRS